METIIEKTKEKKKETKDISKDNAKGKLVVIDDDYNTFQFVISCLIKYCGLDVNLATEYTFKIHNEGKCVVLTDNKSILFPICENLIESGLSAEIEDCDDKEDK